jgi:hypothetical protein
MPKPKIVQVCVDRTGDISSILYSDGRVFLFRYTGVSATGVMEGYWAELTYPNLTKFSPRTKRSKPKQN